MTEAWVLKLKDSSKVGLMPGTYFFFDDPYGEKNVTADLNKATIFEDKEDAIQDMKIHEKLMIEKFGENAIINGGFTNIMKHFDWVEVEVFKGE